MALVNPQYGSPIGTVTVTNNGQSIELPVIATRAFWDYFSSQLYARVGGANAASNVDLMTELPEDAGIEEMKADLMHFKREMRVRPLTVDVVQTLTDMETQVAGLQATITALTQRVESLEQRVA